MADLRTKELSDQVTVRNLIDPKFKTMRISVNMIVPLTEQQVACNALLPAIVSRVTREYPDYTSLSRYLSALYGACLSSSISKIGDNQVLSISASGISNKYALDGENIAAKLTDLICSAIFCPLKDENGLFPADGFKQEKRQLLETIDANFNDKKIYAKRRCLEIFYDDEPAAISRYGSKETVSAVKLEELNAAWERILSTARFELFVLGDCDFASVCKSFSGHFNFDRAPIHLSNKIVLSCGEVKEVTETMKVAQSKLVMAFRTGVTAEDSSATKVMSVLLGGSPSSKLFLNVREKMSLCYYCSSRISDVKGALFVESGVETGKADAAKAAILEQLQDICDGKFTDDDLNFAKLAMVNSYKAVGDSLYAMENWYLNQVFSPQIVSPEDMIEQISHITRIDIIDAARKVSLDTVYILKGEQIDDQQ